jgi:hypothetical protein
VDDGIRVLIHIGYHKTGTTWLQKSLFANHATGYQWLGNKAPPIWHLVLARPLEFDAGASRADLAPLLDDVIGQGRVPVLSFERLSGHPFSGGYDSKEIANRLRDVLPEGRVLIVIREQSDVIASTYKYYVRRGGACSVSRFLKPPGQHEARVPLFDPRHFEYHHLIRHYQALFGDDAVLTLPYDQFARDPVSFIVRIAGFAGRPVPQDVLHALRFERRRHRSPSAAAIAVNRRLNRLVVRSDTNPAPVFASHLAERIARRIDPRQIDRAVPERLARSSEDSLRAVVTAFVGDRYRESNRATAELTGQDLRGYGWTI